MRKILRYTFYPGLLVLSLGTYLIIAPGKSLAELALLQIGIAAASVLIIHPLERLFPYQAAWNKSQGDRLANFASTNIFFPLILKATEVLLTFLLSIGASLYGFSYLNHLWPQHWPVAGQLLLILPICEFCFYWIHRWTHEIPFLWRFHSIHHSIKRVYWDNSGVFHPLDLILNLSIYMLPLFLIQPSPELVGLFVTVNAVTGLLEHANVNFEAGPLNFIFNTAQLHRWHHSPKVAISNKNFGKVISIWDVVFSTWYLPKAERIQKVGVETEDIPSGMWRQFLYPFAAPPKKLHSKNLKCQPNN